MKLGIYFRPQHRRLSTATGVIGLIFFGWMVWQLYQSRMAEITKAEVELKSLSQLIALHHSDLFSRSSLVLELTSHMVKEKSGNLETSHVQLNALLKKELSAMPDFRLIKLYNKVGDSIADTEEFNGDANIREREYFDFHSKNSKPVIRAWGPFKSKNGIWMSFFSTRINDHNGSFSGVLLAGIEVEKFNDFYKSLNLSAGTKIVLTNETGVLVTSTFDETKKSELSPNFSEQSSKITVINPISGYNWSVSVSREYDYILAAWHDRMIKILLSVGFVFLGFSIFMFHYLSSMEELEEQRKQTIQSAKFSSLGEMASGIAHEINNPLAVIVARSTHIREMAAKGDFDRDKLISYSTKIEQTANRVSKIIKGLRSFARNSEKDPFTSVPLETIIEGTLDLCRERLKNNSIELRLETPPPIAIDCREFQISQVLLNLLNNSLDAIENSAEKWVAIKYKDRGNGLEIHVSDSGPGIPDNLKEKIMQPFFTTKEVGKGTGLGLSISRGILLDHNGSLLLNTASPHTCFIVSLPKRQSQLVAA